MTIQDLLASAQALVDKAHATNAAVTAHVAGDGAAATPEQLQQVGDAINQVSGDLDKIQAAVTPVAPTP